MNTTTTGPDPVLVDTQIARLSDEHNAARADADSAAEHARHILGERKVSQGRRRVWPSSNEDAMSALIDRHRTGHIALYNRATVERLIARWDNAQREIGRTASSLATLDAVYREHLWNRYWQVEDGHIHAGSMCAGGTIRPTTRIGLRIELSGREVADAVAELGPTLCSHCFPSAPVEWRRDPAELRAEREAAEGKVCPNRSLTEAQRKAWNPARISTHARCHACKATVSVTKSGQLRKHNKAKRDDEPPQS